MDPTSDSTLQQSPCGPSSLATPSCANACSGLIKLDLLERLRVCAALDRRFCKSWFDELDMERCSNFSDMCITTEWGDGTTYASDSSWQQSADAAFHRISFELQNLEDREKRLTEHVDTLNGQYEALIAELTDSAYDRTVLPRGARRLPQIANIIYAKENEQKRHLYNLRHWNVNLSGVNIPGLPGLLHEVQANNDA